MLKRQAVVKNADIPSKRGTEIENEIIRWYDREDHSLFDVCADDHCQRYQGISKIISTSVEKAINATRGTFLIYNEEICDARYSKACGGRTELFENCWENTPIPYLQSISDSVKAYPPVMKDEDAERWILSSPDVYCNTSESKILRQVLPSFDQETTDFFRWKVEHKREELEEIIHSKSGIDFGTLMDLIPMKRGPSGRINSLKIVGTKHTMTVGKELEIRKWLSKSHLYSSAFIVRIERGTNNIPIRFTLFGAGWGHGVGLCQIGASVMAMKGYKAEDILKHYFPGAKLQTLY
jgi:SpoIID/LytB domain protein